MFKSMLPEVPEYAEMRHNMITSLYHNNDVFCLPPCGCFLSFPRVRTLMCEIEFSHMGKNREPRSGVQEIPPKYLSTCSHAFSKGT